jgi:hypothetical protein
MIREMWAAENPDAAPISRTVAPAACASRTAPVKPPRRGALVLSGVHPVKRGAFVAVVRHRRQL